MFDYHFAHEAKRNQKHKAYITTRHIQNLQLANVGTFFKRLQYTNSDIVLLQHHGKMQKVGEGPTQ